MKKDEPRLKWGELQRLRQSKGYTQGEMGKLLGLSQSGVSNRENDKADEYMEPELARRALEAPVKASKEETAPRRLATLVELIPVRKLSFKLPRLFVAEEPPPQGEGSGAGSAGGETQSGSEPGSAGTEGFVIEGRTGAEAPSFWTAQREQRASMLGLAVLVVGVGAWHHFDEQTNRREAEAQKRVPEPALHCPAEPGVQQALFSPLGVEPANADPGLADPWSQVWLNGGNLPSGSAMPKAYVAAPNLISKAVPAVPHKYQKRPPCNSRGGESEIQGACYLEVAKKPPCEGLLFEHNGTCVVPIFVEPKPPPTTARPGRAGNGSTAEL